MPARKRADVQDDNERGEHGVEHKHKDIAEAPFPMCVSAVTDGHGARGATHPLAVGRERGRELRSGDGAFGGARAGEKDAHGGGESGGVGAGMEEGVEDRSHCDVEIDKGDEEVEGKEEGGEEEGREREGDDGKGGEGGEVEVCCERGVDEKGGEVGEVGEGVDGTVDRRGGRESGRWGRGRGRHGVGREEACGGGSAKRRRISDGDAREEWDTGRRRRDIMTAAQLDTRAAAEPTVVQSQLSNQHRHRKRRPIQLRVQFCNLAFFSPVFCVTCFVS